MNFRDITPLQEIEAKIRERAGQALRSGDEIQAFAVAVSEEVRDSLRKVRGLAQMVACEGHPLLTPRVRRYLDHELNVRDSQQAAWRRHWTVETLAALEGHLAGHRDTGLFCHGAAVSIADICLVSHVTAAVNQQIDLAPYPAVKRIFETAMALPAFANAHPSMQPDTPPGMRPQP